MVDMFGRMVIDQFCAPIGVLYRPIAYLLIHCTNPYRYR